MEFPLFFASVDVCKGEEFGEDGETVLNKSLGGFTYVRLHILWDLMEMIQFVSDHSD